MDFSIMGFHVCVLGKNQRSTLVVEDPRAGTKTRSIVIRKGSWLDRINIPPPPITMTKWEVLKYANHVQDIFKYLTNQGSNGPWLATSDVRELAEMLGRENLPEVKDALAKLRLVHCINLETLPQDIVKDIPELINMVLGTNDPDPTVERCDEGRITYMSDESDT